MMVIELAISTLLLWGHPRQAADVFALSKTRTDAYAEHGKCIDACLSAESKLRALGDLPKTYAPHLKVIQDERERIRQELLSGAFCSLCGKSKTQLGGAVAFRAHLGTVRGEAVPPTAAQLEEAMRPFDVRIKNLDKNWSDYQDALGVRAKNASQAGWLFNAWTQAAETEEIHRKQAWGLYVHKQQERARAIDKQYDELVILKDKNKTNEKLVNVINNSLNLLTREFSSLVSESVGEHIRQDSNLKSFRESATSERAVMFSNTLKLSNNYMIAGSQYAQAYVTTPLRLSTLPLPKVQFPRL